jgi:hypothetical protein
MFSLNRIYRISWFLSVFGMTGCSLLENPEPRKREIVLTYELYDYIPTAKKFILLNEEFDNNSRGWRIVNNSSQYSMNISGGELKINNRDNIRQQNTIDFPALKVTDDFEIEAQIRVSYSSVEGDGGDGNVLYWGLSPAVGNNPGQGSYYGVDNGGRAVKIGSFNGPIPDYEYFQFDYSSGEYNYDDYNTITVRKVNQTCYYFLNGKFLTKKAFVPFYGSRIGFGVNLSSTIQIPYLKVSRLNIN